MFAPLALQEVVVGELRLWRLAQPVAACGFITGHLPVNHSHLSALETQSLVVTITEQVSSRFR